MTCLCCQIPTNDLRFGFCFDCASEGDIRLGKRSTLQHLAHAIRHAFKGHWFEARVDLRCGWERIWRTGDYAQGRDWESL